MLLYVTLISVVKPGYKLSYTYQRKGVLYLPMAIHITNRIHVIVVRFVIRTTLQKIESAGVKGTNGT